MKILVVGHGTFASGVKSLMKLLTGVDESIVALDFTEDKSYDVFENEVQSVIAHNDDLIVFADITGGTPFQISSRLVLSNFKSENQFVVSGISVACMLDLVMNTIVNEDFKNLKKKIDDSLDLMKDSVLVLSRGDIDNE